MTGYTLNEYAMPLLVTGVVVLFLGMLTLVQERGSRVAGPAALTALTLTIWTLGVGAMYSATTVEAASLAAKLAHAGFVFFPAATLYSTVRVLDAYRRTRPLVLGGLLGSFMLFLTCIGGKAFLADPQLYGWGYYFSYGPVGAVFVLFFGLMMGSSLYLYWRSYRSAPQGSAMQRRAGLLFASLAIGCLCAVDFFAAYQVAIPPVGYLAILGQFGIMTYVTWHYHLVDITPSVVGGQLIDTMSDGLLVLDTEGLIRLANPAAVDLLGTRDIELIGQRAAVVLPDPLFQEGLAALRCGERLRSIEVPYVCPDGESRTLSLSASVMHDRHGQANAFVCVLCDITKRKVAEDRIRFLAYYDNLTDLPNRTQFNEQLERTLNEARIHNRKVAMFFLDLDRFKRINDTLGHAAGDQLLQAVAERLRNCVRSCDFLTRNKDSSDGGSIVARLGGDEFIVALSDIARSEDGAIVARRMLDVLAEPFGLENQEVFVSASIGISMYPRDGLDSQSIMKGADIAMYHAKDAGRNNYQFYQASMNATNMERLALEADLRKALENDEFELHYQPQVNYRTGRVIGSEALLRWRHPLRGMLTPDEFIGLAEEAGLVPAIGEWVLRTACHQNHSWQQSGYGPMRIAVNLSERQFRQHNLIGIVAKALNESGMNPRSLDLELTEGIIMENSKETLAALYELKSMGVKVSVDDFGTGYSSLGYLKRFPVDILKIDHTFVRDIVTSPDDAAIVTAIIAMARSLKLDVIAEGVETPAQAAFLDERGCKFMQGFMFGRPLPAHKLEKVLKPSPLQTGAESANAVVSLR